MRHPTATSLKQARQFNRAMEMLYGEDNYTMRLCESDREIGTRSKSHFLAKDTYEDVSPGWQGVEVLAIGRKFVRCRVGGDELFIDPGDSFEIVFVTY